MGSGYGESSGTVKPCDFSMLSMRPSALVMQFDNSASDVGTPQPTEGFYGSFLGSGGAQPAGCGALPAAAQGLGALLTIIAFGVWRRRS